MSLNLYLLSIYIAVSVKPLRLLCLGRLCGIAVSLQIICDFCSSTPDDGESYTRTCSVVVQMLDEIHKSSCLVDWYT